MRIDINDNRHDRHDNLVTQQFGELTIVDQFTGPDGKPEGMERRLRAGCTVLSRPSECRECWISRPYVARPSYNDGDAIVFAAFRTEGDPICNRSASVWGPVAWHHAESQGLMDEPHYTQIAITEEDAYRRLFVRTQEDGRGMVFHAPVMLVEGSDGAVTPFQGKIVDDVLRRLTAAEILRRSLSQKGWGKPPFDKTDDEYSPHMGWGDAGARDFGLQLELLNSRQLVAAE